MAEWDDFTREVPRGDTHPFRFQVLDDAGDPVDTTAWTAFWVTAKLSPGAADADAVFQLTLGSGITRVDDSTGLLEALLPAGWGASLIGLRVPVALPTDIQGKDGSGRIWTLLRGQIRVLPTTTRSTS